MAERRNLVILTVSCAVLVLFVLAGCNNRSIKGDYEKGVAISPELLAIEVDYSIYQFPSPVAPMSYVIRINNEGVLSKEYFEAEYFEDYNDITIQLSQSELVELIDIVVTNNFFKLSENLDGTTHITDQPSRHLAITYDGKTHKCDGYNTKNEKYLAICDYIEKLSEK